jgi:hypothetical protein
MPWITLPHHEHCNVYPEQGKVLLNGTIYSKPFRPSSDPRDSLDHFQHIDWTSSDTTITVGPGRDGMLFMSKPGGLTFVLSHD